MYFYDPDSREEMLTYLYQLDTFVIQYMDVVDEYLSTADDYNRVGDYYNAIKQLCIGISAFTEVTRYYIKGVSTWCVDWPQTYFLEHHTIGSFDWKSICEAWAKNDFEGRAPTIAFIDRMRQLLWDEPFFVAWAARPEEQEL